MSFTNAQKSRILKLKSSIASYYNLQMKKLGDKKLESLFFEHCIITGGCISSLADDAAVKDIDLYAKTAKGMNEIKDYILNHCHDIIKSYDKYIIDNDGNKLTTVSGGEKAITNNAVTLVNDVQFVYLGEAEDCRKKFDFIHCMPWFDIGSQKLHISEEQWRCIEQKVLRINPMFTEDLKQKRIDKYVKRGYQQTTMGVVAQEIGQMFPGTMYINTPT